jgi:methyl-accepting chemotaxis protein
MKFSNLKIATRLAFGFGGVLALLILVIALGMTRLSNLNENVQLLVTDRIVKLNTANDWIIQLLQSAQHMRNVLIVSSDQEIKKEIDSVMEEKAVRKADMELLQKIVVLPAAKMELQKIVEARATYTPYEDEFLKLATAGDLAGAKEVLIQKARPTQIDYINAIQKFIDIQKDAATASGVAAQEEYKSGLTLMSLLGLCAVLVGAVVGWFIAHGLLKQLGGEPNDAASIATSIAEGDLTVAVTTRNGDQTSLMFAMKTMRDNLLQIVNDVRSGTDTIATASNQIAAGNMDLSARTEQQAGALEETASSMEELTSTVKQNADNARQANQLAGSASDVAVKGGTVVAQVVETMGAINDSAKKIVDIIGVIDGIAFQTNILALNAAVEAARAGEQGRGFAVVAAEVRNLAQRSAGAAKEIKMLISDSVEKVDAGSKLVDQAGTTMNEVVDSCKRVSDIISEIAAASSEQTAGIEQINQAITQMDEVTQQNAALVEEAAAAAGSMQEQAGHLVETVSIFKTGSALAAAYKPSRPAPATAANVTKISAANHGKRAPARVPARAPLKQVANDPSGGEWETF